VGVTWSQWVTPEMPSMSTAIKSFINHSSSENGLYGLSILQGWGRCRSV
jgi:hypothetical protein